MTENRYKTEEGLGRISRYRGRGKGFCPPAPASHRPQRHLFPGGGRPRPRCGSERAALRWARPRCCRCPGRCPPGLTGAAASAEPGRGLPAGRRPARRQRHGSRDPETGRGPGRRRRRSRVRGGAARRGGQSLARRRGGRGGAERRGVMEPPALAARAPARSNR